MFKVASKMVFAGCLAVVLSATVAQADVVAPPASSSFLLRVEGKPAGVLQSTTGGIKGTDIVLAQSLGAVATPLAQWLSSPRATKSGEIGPLSFKDAIPVEYSLPGGDKANKSPRGPLTVKLRPASTTIGTGAAALPAAPASGLAADFRFEVDRLPPTAIARFDGFSGTATTSGKISFGNISLYVPTSALKPFQDWYQDVVINRNDERAANTNATLEYLDSAGAKQLTVRFIKVIPFNITAAANQQVRVNVSVESVVISSPR